MREFVEAQGLVAYAKPDGSINFSDAGQDFGDGVTELDAAATSAALDAIEADEAESFDTQSAAIEAHAAARAADAQAFVDAGVPAEAVERMFGVKFGKGNNGNGNNRNG